MILIDLLGQSVCACADGAISGNAEVAAAPPMK
jgi:hypothetical protein